VLRISFPVLFFGNKVNKVIKNTDKQNDFLTLENFTCLRIGETPQLSGKGNILEIHLNKFLLFLILRQTTGRCCHSNIFFQSCPNCCSTNKEISRSIPTEISIEKMALFQINFICSLNLHFR